MTTELKPDICIIGAGSGGLSVAAAAAAFGESVVLVEKGKMGGDCLNYGCVPSKALIAATNRLGDINSAAAFGLVVPEGTKADFKKVHAHVHEIINTIAPNDSIERFRGFGVNVIQAQGRFVDRKTLEAGDFLIKASRFVIATGSSPLVPPIPGIEDVDYWTNETFFENAKPVRRLAIIGGGPIGMELAQACQRLGSRVTIFEAQTVMQKDDRELVQVVLDKLRREGVTIHEHASVKQVEKSGRSAISIHYLKNGESLELVADRLLVATGRKPNVEGLDLEKAGVETLRRGIKTDAYLRTSNRKVYAIGDVTGGLQFTHAANYHAGIVIRNMLFRMFAKPDELLVPWTSFTNPELAHVGMNETQAREKHSTINVLRWPYADNDRAVTERNTTGLIKMVVDRKGRILGVSIVGHNAGEMINMWALAISKKLTAKEIAAFVSPYPTMSEIGKRAAMSFYSPMARKPFVRRMIGLMKFFG